MSDLVVQRVAFVVEAVPQRDRHAEEPLPADQPIAVQPADPVLVAVVHVWRMPDQFLAAFRQCGPECVIAAAVADVPLAGGNDLEGS